MRPPHAFFSTIPRRVKDPAVYGSPWRSGLRVSMGRKGFFVAGFGEDTVTGTDKLQHLSHQW